MTMLNKLFSSKKTESGKLGFLHNKVFWLFVAIHIVLFNVNFAEWGDSYRILRGAEYIRELSYPDDEKRQPLYSIALALRPEAVDQVLWGRLEMFAISIAAFAVFYHLLDLFKLGKREKSLALLLFTFNPTFLYWSLRLMADVPFALLALITFFFYKKWQKELTYTRIAALGVLIGLAALTRFEGFVLGLSVGIGLLLQDLDFNKWLKDFRPRLLQGLTLFVSFLVIFFPWLVLRNPFTSTYFEEPGGREYDVHTLVIYLASLAFLFGFAAAPLFFKKYFKELVSFFKQNLGLSIFVLIELFLALIWPAAIPRLFTPIIPFLLIPLAVFVNNYFTERKTSKWDYAGLVLLLVAYVAVQFQYRLQFLVLMKPLLALTILFQLSNFLAIYLKRFNLFRLTLFLSLVIWSISTIYLHKDIFRAVVVANRYVVDNLQGKVVYNDVSSVSDWYLNQRARDDAVLGEYLNMDSKAGRTYDLFLKEEADYAMITNEHNPTLEFSAGEVEHLDEIKEFRYTIGGKEFFTKILKFNK